jgi:hypothetical protein
MEIFNETSFPVTQMIWEDLQGQAKLTVIVKVTFTINNGKSIPADEQLPIFTADEHYGEDPLKPVKFESDMVPFKPRADVVLVGKAYSPGLKPVKRLDVSLRVGRVKKTIRVLGDRKWRFTNRVKLIPSISPPIPFVKMDLTYENSFGGIDSDGAAFCRENIFGKGIIGKKTPKSINGRPLPNLEDPYNLISSWKSRPKPVGFGFYGRGNTPRLSYAGTYNEKHENERAPALPVDFSYRIFNGAHPSLQVKGYLRGNEEVELVNLSYDPVIRFDLPGIRPNIVISRWSKIPNDWIEQNTNEESEGTFDQVPMTEEPIETVLDTLVLIPDEGIFYEVFRGVCLLPKLGDPDVAQIRITT